MTERLETQPGFRLICREQSIKKEWVIGLGFILLETKPGTESQMEGRFKNSMNSFLTPTTGLGMLSLPVCDKHQKSTEKRRLEMSSLPLKSHITVWRENSARNWVTWRSTDGYIKLNRGFIQALIWMKQVWVWDLVLPLKLLCFQQAPSWVTVWPLQEQWAKPVVTCRLKLTCSLPMSESPTFLYLQRSRQSAAHRRTWYQNCQYRIGGKDSKEGEQKYEEIELKS